jgi:uncharacterized protein YjiS (DUF1127 family)
MLKKIYTAIINARMAQVKKMLESYEDYRIYVELNQLSDKQLDDVGLHRNELAKFVFIDRHAA